VKLSTTPGFTALPRWGRSTAALAAVALLAVACGSSGDGSDSTAAPTALQSRDTAHQPADWSSVVDAANKEGSVVVYTNLTTAQVDPINKAFNAIYPKIKVQMVNDSVATLPTRFSQERSSTGKSAADVLESSLFESVITKNPSWFTDLTTSDKGFIPVLQDFDPAAVPADRPHSVTSAAYTWRLVYNKNKVKAADLPKSWSDVADPKWSGKMVIADPRAASTYMAFFRLLYDNLGPSFMQGLQSNKFGLSQAAADVAQKVASGAYPIGFPVNVSTVSALLKSGAPIATLELLPAEIGATTTAFPTLAPHPNAARVYGNFILSGEGQELMCAGTSLASLNKTAAGACLQNKVPAGLQEMKLQIAPSEATAVTSSLGLK
jgi:iron(III) transport system substrate-binding protein